MSVVLDDLATDGGGRIIGGLALGVGVPDNGARDQWWLALGGSDDRSLVHPETIETRT